MCGRKAEIGGPHFHEVAVGAQPREGQWRVGASDDHEVQLRWQVFQQKRHPLVDGLGVDGVIVLEHDREVLPNLSDLVDQDR